MKRTILLLTLLLGLAVLPAVPPALGSAHQSPGSPAPEVITIAEARAMNVGDTVSIQGTASVAAGTTNAGFAIQDATAGIYIYPSSFVAVELGDIVLLTGTLASYNCLLEVTPSPGNVAIVGSEPAPVPLPYATSDIGEASEGWLVVVTGTVSGLGSQSFYVDDGSGSTYVYIDTDTGISLGNVHDGDLVRVIGFSSQFDGSAPCDTGWQIVPRMQSDLRVIDVDPPGIDSTIPADGATEVSSCVAPQALFDEAIDPATLAMTLTGPAGVVPGTVSYDSPTQRGIFTPAAPLQPNATFTALVPGTVEDWSGNPMGSDYTWSFTTALDMLPPLVVAVRPTGNDVSIYTTVQVTFSEAMDPASIHTGTVVLKKGTAVVPGTVSYDPVTFRATFRPQALLEENTQYQATVKAGVRDCAGNAMGFDYPWSFRTGVAPAMASYHGDIHNHTSYSDGSGTPQQAFATAQACGLDFLALTDHSYAISDPEWADTLARAEEATQDGVFVALRGFEYTQGAEGHINVYNTVRHATRALVPGCTYCDYTPNLEPGVTVQGFYPWLAITGTQAVDGLGTVMQFNHPGWMNFNDWRYHPEVEDVAELEEVGNGWGVSYTFSYDEWIRSLDYGWQVAATNNSDNHELGWGCITPHRTGVVMPEDPGLTKENLLAALRARRTFASEDANFDLFFTANGYWMGSELPNNGQLLIDTWAEDPDISDTVALVQLVTTQGQVITATQPGTPGYHWTFALPIAAGSQYFFILVEQTDGDRIVSSPVWTSGTDDIRVTDLAVQPSLPTIYSPSLLTARLTNRGETTQTVTVTFAINGAPLADFPATLTPCGTGPCGDVFLPFSWQPVVTGPVTVTAAIVGAPPGDNPVDNSRALHMTVSDEKIPLILIDAGHNNIGVEQSGLRLFVDDMTAHGYNMLFNLDEITAGDLNTETVRLLILNAYGPSQLTAAELQAVSNYVQAGGGLWLGGMSDYTGKVSWANTVADRENGLIEAVEPAIPVRVNDDEVLDGNDNNGYPWGVLWHNFPASMTTGIGVNVSRIQSWSDSSLVDAGHGALTPADLGGDGFIAAVGDTDPGSGTYGYPNYTHNTDADGDGDMYAYISPTLVPFAVGYDIPGPAGRVMFYGDSNDPFNIFAYVAGDDKQNEIYNLETVMWLLGDPLQPWTIAQARADAGLDDTPDHLGRLVWVEGAVTAAFGEFFDVLYVQDGTGGITCFAPAGDIYETYERGDLVRVVATVDAYQGDTELQFVESSQIQRLGPGALPDPLVLPTHDAALEESEGWLLQTEGLVTRWQDANSFVIDDGSGPCRVFLDGYNNDPDDPTFDSIAVSDRVRVVGLGSEDYYGQRIRVRAESDIAVVGHGFAVYLPLVVRAQGGR